MMKMTIVIGFVFVAVAFLPASATIINIPDDYETIQEGIDASIDGDTVLVQPGTYYENIDFNGHNIVLGSLFLTTGDTSYISQTVIDGNSSGSVVTFESGEDSTAVINGFKIQNGYDQFGGGIFCESSNPVIENSIISRNSAENGGGIHCGNSYLTLINNIIIENTAENGGAGIDNFGGDPALFGCVISANNAGSYGGGISNDMCSPIIANCVITNNTATGAGGGISNYTFSQATFINCTFSNNSAGYGGAIWNGASTPTLVNCILWGDTPDEFSGDQSIVSYSDIQGGWPGEGNIDFLPLFRDPVDGDFHLKADSCGDVYNSPCIDAGDPAIFDSMLGCDWGLGELRSDMGAYGGGDSVQVGIDDKDPRAPGQFTLTQNYPNPFNLSTTISFSLPEARFVQLTVYNLLGREVKTLLNDYKPAGVHHITLDASDLASGIYFYQLQAGESVESRRMVLLK